MDTNKASNPFSNLRNKYGGESVKLLRDWENIVRKMVDFRNHRRFSLRCIKVKNTHVSCKLKNSPNSRKSYQIFHKADKTTYV